MGAIVPEIKDPEVEAGELTKVLHQVGKALRVASDKRSKTGLSYAQFKAHLLKSKVKAVEPSHDKR